jgi:hypothetical protein
MRAIALALCLLLAVPGMGEASKCSDSLELEVPAARRYPALARTIGITVDAEWVDAHVEAIHESFAPGLEAYAGCVSVWGNPVQFCRQLLTVELRSRCEASWDIDSDLRGWQQCRAVADIFSIAQGVPTGRSWPAIQRCAAEESAGKEIGSPVVVLDPPAPAPGEHVELVVRAIHPERGLPMYGVIRIEGTMVGPTFEKLDFAMRFVESRDELGRISMRLPVVSVEALPARGSGFPGFPSAFAGFTTPIPTTRLTFDPPPGDWRVGENRVRVTAVDETSGEVLEGRIMKAGAVLGDSRDPITIVLSGDEVACGEPVWFRPSGPHRPDESFPIAPCSSHPAQRGATRAALAR